MVLFYTDREVEGILLELGVLLLEAGEDEMAVIEEAFSVLIDILAGIADEHTIIGEHLSYEFRAEE